MELRYRSTRWLPALVLSLIMAGPAVAHAPRPGPTPAEACVVDPVAMQEALLGASAAQKVLEGLDPLATGTWEGEIFVLPWLYDGSYDRDEGGGPNVLPRQWVARSFFQDNPDRYDFLLVFTNFRWDAGPQTRGLYWSIANYVSGIGIDTFDLSQEFGSGRLEGYIDGMRLADYRTSSGELDERLVREILNHELGHRWLVHPQVDSDGGPSDDLLGRDGSHWSYLLDSDASFLYGSKWSDNGDGTFTATEVRRRFSDLDLYLMGMIPPEDVAPFVLLENPEIDTTQLPLLGDTVEAVPRTLGVEDVIAAEGPRFPAADVAEHEFDVGVIYLVDPAIGVAPQDLDLLDDLRRFWKQSVFRHTRGRAVVDPAFQGDLPPGGAAADLQTAIDWLSRQGEILWQDSPLTAIRDTAEAVEALGRAGGHFDAVEDALRVLPATAAGSAELRYRRLEALARWSEDPQADWSELADAVVGERDEHGGWAALPRYSSDPVTTARAVRALAAARRPAEAAAGWDWLAARRNADGGWGWQVGSPSSVPATLEVLSAARALDPAGFWDLPEVAEGIAWLLGKRVDGGFGDPFP
ncbi:MAG: hypothetical protein MI919_08250, partial [Holophagales bacterium]|nr:hypothetical protein [Holophagales bacterium]